MHWVIASTACSVVAVVVLAVVLVAVVLLVVRAAGRGSADAERYVVVHGLSGDALTRRLVSNHLERNVWFRRTGAWVAFLVVVLLSLLRLRTSMSIPPLPEVLAGSLIGMALAESYRLRDLPAGERLVSMEPRSVLDYRSKVAHAEPAFWTCVLIVAGVLGAALTHRHQVRGTGLIVAATVLGAASFVFERLLSNRIVQRGRPLLGDDLTIADDHLRASALESLRLATNGLVLCLVVAIGVAAMPALLPTEVQVRRGDVVARIYDAKAIRQTPTSIEWTDRGDHVHVIPYDTLAERGDLVVRHNTQGRWAALWWIVALVLSVWAWGCWRQASRVAYDRSVRPLRNAITA